MKPLGRAQENLDGLVTAISQNRDKEAFRALFIHFAPRIKSYLLNFKLSDQTAEDLMQDVMVKVWQKAAQFDARKAKLSTWIFTIARNRYIDHVRKQKYPMVNADDHMNEMVSGETADAGAIDNERAERVCAALAKLKADQRRVITLSFFQEMSHTEIAETLGLPLGTVKSRIRLAFKTLRSALGDYE